MTSRLPAALLWDFDGTMVDTEGIWLEEELAVARDAEVTLEPTFWQETLGRPVIDTCAYFCARTERDVTPRQLADQLVAGMVQRLRTDPPALLPGVEALLGQAREAGVAQAVVSASWRVILDPIVTLLPADLFGAIITGDIVERGKPDPECYLRAARELGVDPSDCIAIEDSPTGAAAANAAGCFVIAITNRVRPPDAPRRAHLDTLDGVSLSDLVALRDAGQQC